MVISAQSILNKLLNKRETKFLAILLEQLLLTTNVLNEADDLMRIVFVRMLLCDIE